MVEYKGSPEGISYVKALDENIARAMAVTPKGLEGHIQGLLDHRDMVAKTLKVERSEVAETSTEAPAEEESEPAQD